MLTRMLQRRGTTAQWNDVKDTLILASGEIGIIFDSPDIGNNGKFKIGDGVTLWKNLDFYLKDSQNDDIYAKLTATQTFLGTQTLTPATAISVPLVVSGAASQSGNLQNWNNSSETTLASINSAGKLTAAGASFTAAVDMASQKITSLATPTASTDAANKSYVDAVKTGLDVKDSVRLVLTGSAVTLTGLLTVDSVVTVAGNRVLVAFDGGHVNNGIWVVASGAWTRATDADSSTEVTAGMYTFVEEGTNYADSGWVLTTNNTITLGTTAITFVQFSGAGQITAGTGMSKTGNTLNVGGTTDRITANADTIDIASTYAGQSSITTVSSTTGITTGLWRASTIDTDKGGTGITSYAVGDLLYASGTTGATQLSKLTAGTANYVLLSGGANTAPSWGQVVTASLANASSTTTGVTYAKMQYVSATNKVLGRITAGSGVVEELSADNIISIISGGTTNISFSRIPSSTSGGNNGTATTVARSDHTHTLGNLSDVVITGTPVERQVVKFNGTTWVNELPSGGISVGATSPAAPASGDAWMDSNDGSLYVYYNDTTSRPAGTNLITNPSFETNTTGWTGTSATIAQSTAFEYVGASSLKVTPSTNTGKVSFTATTVASTVYRFSAYVYTEQNKNLRVSITTPATNGTTTAVAYNTWTRLDVSFTASAASTVVNIESIDSTIPFYVDGVMLEASATLNDYFDGSSYNGAWSGTAHASPSTTTGGTTAQWVQVRANSALEATILTRMSAVESRATNLEAASPVVVSSVAERNALFPAPVQGNTVWRKDLGYMERYYDAYNASTNFSGTTGTVGWYEYRGGAPLSENYVINSGFTFFQRSTFASQTASGYSLDRWYTAVGGTVTVTQQTTGVPVGSEYCARVAYNAATSFGNMYHAFEMLDAVKMVGKTVTFSVKLRRNATFAANINITIQKNATANTMTGGTWSTIATTTVTNASLPTGTTSSDWYSARVTAAIPNDGTANGVRIQISESAAGASGAYYEIAQVLLEDGPVPTDYRRNQQNIQAELAACQRYYYRVTGTVGGAGQPLLGQAGCFSTTSFDMYVNLPTTMRSSSMTIDSANLGVYSIGGAVTAASGTLTVQYPNVDKPVIRYVHGTAIFTTNTFASFVASGASVAYIGISAEL